MAETPTYIWSVAMSNLEDLIANCAGFRTWTGTADVAAAKARIYLVATESTTKPFALISQGDDFNIDSHSGGTAQFYETSGSLFLRFDDDVNPSYTADPENAEMEFTNAIGLIFEQMMALSGTSGYMHIYNIQKMYGPRREDRDEKSSGGQYNQAKFNIVWGI